MFAMDSDLTIHITRGDIGVINVSASSNDSSHIFKPNDIVRLKIFQKKNCNAVVLTKDVTVYREASSVDINLFSDDTKIGEIINKPVDYWYEIELNPETYPQTIIGYDQKGPKIFRLYPEGGDNQ
jgi:hypothetical protein